MYCGLTFHQHRLTCVVQIEKTTFLNMFANDSREALADFELKVVQRKAELSHVISHPIGLKLFTQALKKEYSAENINVRAGCSWLGSVCL